MMASRTFHVGVRAEHADVFFQSFIVAAESSADAERDVTTYLLRTGCRSVAIDPATIWETERYPRSWRFAEPTPEGVIAESERIWVRPRFRKPGARHVGAFERGGSSPREFASAVLGRLARHTFSVVLVRERVPWVERAVRHGSRSYCGRAELISADGDDLDEAVRRFERILDARRPAFHVLAGTHDLPRRLLAACRESGVEAAERSVYADTSIFVESYPSGVVFFADPGAECELELLFPEMKRET